MVILQLPQTWAKMAAIQNPKLKMSGFQMFPDFESPVFGSALYILMLRGHYVWLSHTYARRRCREGALFCSTSFTFCNTNISCSLIPKENIRVPLPVFH